MADSNAKKLAQFLTASGTYNLYDVQADSTGFFDLPTGTTAQRPTAVSGMIRFNSTLGLSEYYNGTTWIAIDAPPSVSSIDPANIADSDSDVDITISGSNFSTNASVVAIGQDGSEITPTTIVRTDSTELVATFDGTDFLDAQEDYSIKVTNSSGLANILSNSLAVNATPVWTVASGSLGTFYDSTRTGISITTGATDSEGATLTYAVASGSLPTGLSLNTSTGAITGDANAVGSDTTSNFTLSVTDGTNTTTRAYSITINAPVVTSYTSTGSGTFSVPSGLTAVDVLVVAGGGSGGISTANAVMGGGGGAGGLIYRPAFPVTPGGSISYSVGGGGDGSAMSNATSPGNTINRSPGFGQDSTFGALTAKGGGCGGSGDFGTDQNGPGQYRGNDGMPGGSGGGNAGWGNPGTPGASGGTGIQPSQPGDSGTYGFGNDGGRGGNPGTSGGGGGGAGADGTGQLPNAAGVGGAGKQYGISGSQVYYAGGGGCGGYINNNPGTGGAGGQGGGGNGGNNPSPGSGNAAQSGQANRGSGGGGVGAAYGFPNGRKDVGDGGTGIIIVSY
jgi:hypothetical protein